MAENARTETLIETVRKFPVLYDKNDPNHKVKRLKDRAWQSVGKSMDETPDVLKSRWKNLRDSFSKHLRCQNSEKQTTSKHIERYKYWPWVEQMQFVRPFLDPQSANGVVWTKKPAKSKKLPGRVTSPTVARRKRKLSEPSVEAAEEDRRSGRGEYDETDLIFLGYSKIVKRMSALRQASTRYQVAQVLMQAEVDQANEIACSETIFKSSPKESLDSE